jgi:hypothetical protein
MLHVLMASCRNLLNNGSKQKLLNPCSWGRGDDSHMSPTKGHAEQVATDLCCINEGV